MMTRRLYLRIFAALLATAVLSFVAFVWVFFRLTAPVIERLVYGTQASTLQEAVQALDTAGPARAMAVLTARDTLGQGTYYLTDAAGRDLVSGADRSRLLAGTTPGGRPASRDGKAVFVQASPDGRYRLIALATPPFGFLDILPYYTLLLAAVALLCWAVAIDIVSPVRRMAAMVEQFGRGELHARTGVLRHDEIGDLAGAVDHMAERIETLVSAERRLLQDVSHELRSPLARLGLAIELARTTPDRDASAARLQRDVQRLSGLVATLLEVTRLEGEDAEAGRDVIDLAGILRTVVHDVEIEARARDVRIDVRLGPASCRGDAELIRRAAENVIRNAVRYTPEGGTVDVHLNATSAGATVTVRDYGPGVPDGALARLGTPFFRVDRSRDASSGGVGLGLAIARRAIERHGGRWQVENARPGLRVKLMLATASASEPAGPPRH